MRRITLVCIVATLGFAAGPADRLAAQETDILAKLTDLETPTLGGMQFWADEALLHQYRVQRNALTGRYRLLDGADRRLAHGSLEHCQAELQRIALENNIAPMRGEVVLVLHGLFRTRGSMADMCDYLREHTDMEVIDLGYPSTRESVGQHAQTLARAVESLKGVERVHFVAHSLGNLVIRHYLNDRSAVAATEGLPPLGRLVMLAPPNQQPILATRLARLDVTRQVGGPALVELSTGWADLAPRLATPRIEFGVLAGGPGGLPFRNPLVPGESDLVVTVESTRLVGARDFRVVPTEHTFIMDDPTVQRLTAEFLKFGHFENEDARRPIVEEVVETPAAVGQGP